MISSNGVKSVTPALLTTMVIGPKASRSLADGGLHLAAIGHVGTERDGLAACRLDRRDRVGAALLVEVEHADGDAFLREPLGTGRADARRRAGNECHFGGCHRSRGVETPAFRPGRKRRSPLSRVGLSITDPFP